MDFKKIRLNDDYIRLGLICLSLVITYVFIITPLGLNRRSYLFFQDITTGYAYRFFYSTHKNPDITIIAIDDASLRQEDLKWPWPRAKFAELINRISSYRPKVIALDIAFVGKSSYGQEDDERLAGAIREAGNVVLASYIGKEELPMLVITEPAEDISEQARGVGFVNKIKDEHFIMRSARAVVPQQDRFKYSFEVETVALYKDLPSSQLGISGRELVLGPERIRLNWDGTFSIKYTEKGNNFSIISVSDILKGPIDPALIRDKLVMVGQTAIVQHDIHLTPLGSMPGVIISANVVDNIINGDIMQRPSPAYMFIFLLVIGIAIVYIGLSYPLILSLLITVTTVAMLIFVAVFAFSSNIELDPFGITILLFISLGSSRFYLSVKSHLERLKMLNLLITDQDSGLYNIYYLLLKLQQQLKTSKEREELPALVLLEVLDNKGKPLSSTKLHTQKEFIISVASIIKEYTRPLNGVVARTGDFEFGIMIPRYKSQAPEQFIDSIYQRMSNLELFLPREQRRLVITAAIGIVGAEDLEEKSAELIFYAGKEGLSRARDLTDKKICFFDPKKEKISLYGQTKPLSATEGRLVDFVIEDLKRRNKQLLDKIVELDIRINDLKKSYLTIISSLVKALEEKDVYTAGHSERVASYSAALADKLNLSDFYRETLREAALLHDIGKIGIPDSILHKKGRLNEEEMEIVKRHQIESVKILEPATFLKDTIPIILHHHEHYDGSGYPHGLTGERIPLGARIIAIADAFDAMTSGRTYNRPLHTQEVISTLRKEAGRQFDPDLVEKFIEVVKEFSSKSSQK